MKVKSEVKHHGKTGLRLQNTRALGSQHTLHACTWYPRTISQCGQGDAAMQQPPREIVSQQSQSRSGREGLPFHFQYVASTRADSTVDDQEHTERLPAPY